MSRLEYFIDEHGNLKSTRNLMIKDVCENPHIGKPHKEKSEGYKRGYLEAQIILDEVELHHIEINPAYRRQGLAHQLLTHFIQEVKTKGAVRIFLEVSVKNDPALNLYHKFGFLEIGIRKGYYKDADGSLIDAYQMEKIL